MCALVSGVQTCALPIPFALGISTWGEAVPGGVLQGLKIAAVAVVAQAVWGMARSLCTGVVRVTIMAIVSCVVLAWPGVWGQVSMIVAAGFAGLFLFKATEELEHEPLDIQVSV